MHILCSNPVRERANQQGAALSSLAIACHTSPSGCAVPTPYALARNTRTTHHAPLSHLAHSMIVSQKKRTHTIPGRTIHTSILPLSPPILHPPSTTFRPRFPMYPLCFPNFFPTPPSLVRQDDRDLRPYPWPRRTMGRQPLATCQSAEISSLRKPPISGKLGVH